MSPGGTILVFLSEAAINILFVLARYRHCPDRGAATEVGHLCIAFCMAMGSWLWGLNFCFLNVSNSLSSFPSNRFGDRGGKKQGEGRERSYQILDLAGEKR